MALAAQLSFVHTGYAQVSETPISFGFSINFYSEVLSENRVLNIYLPEGFDAKDTTRYPLIILPDGGTNEDFFHIAGLVRFCDRPWVEILPPSILVGIENTDRKRDFTFPVSNLDFLKEMGVDPAAFERCGGSEDYIRFLTTELIPFMEKNYRAGRPRTLIGESLAGLLVCSALLNKCDSFDRYLISSPSLWWDDGSLIAKAKALSKSDCRPMVCIVAPNRAEDEEMFRQAEAFYNAILQAPGAHSIFEYLPAETHATVFHQAVYRGFVRMKGK